MVAHSASRLALDSSFYDRLGAARAQPAPVADAATVERIITGVVSTLAGDVSLADIQLYREVESLGDYIQTARREIAGIRPDDIRSQHIPTATDELDAVVTATAEATNVILGAMEQVERLSVGLSPEVAAPLGDIVVKVYEACGFQDITGQRITKVVKALRHIESKIDALLAVFGAEFGLHDAPEAPPEPAANDEANLLNGPALPAVANSQADIDALLASFD